MASRLSSRYLHATLNSEGCGALRSSKQALLGEVTEGCVLVLVVAVVVGVAEDVVVVVVLGKCLQWKQPDKRRRAGKNATVDLPI